MGFYKFVALFLISYFCLPEEIMAGSSGSRTKLRGLDRRLQFARMPVSGDFIFDEKEDGLAKRQEQFDDYGHMRFGKRGEESDDYGHMRFGKRD